MSVLCNYCSMNTAELFELDKRALDSIQKYPKQRFIMKELAEMSGRPFVMLQGPRGAGKTVLLRQIRSMTRDSIYISSDTFDRGESLFDAVVYLHSAFAIQVFFIDEIHYLEHAAGDLKKLFDFSDVQVFCTSSSSLRIQDSAYDLSRRVIVRKIPQCSFREYLYFIYGKQLPELSLKDLVTGNIPREYLHYSKDFERYLQGGGYLFLLESGATIQQFGSMLATICTRDIPAVKRDFSMEDLRKIEEVIAFIGKAPAEGINYSSISRNIGITKYKAQQYISLLEKAFLLTCVFPDGANVLKEPKVFMELPYRLLYRSYQDCIGALREDFFASAMNQGGITFQYLKSKRGKKTPDFIIQGNDESIVLEVGGKGKGRSQFKDVTYDRKIILYHSSDDVRVSSDRIPLFLLGFI